SIALLFAARGHAVVVAGRNHDRGEEVARQCRVNGGQGVFVPCDLTQPESASTVADYCIDKFGTPQVLINSAGLLQSGTRVLDQDLQEDERLWQINYRGTLIACQAFGRLMQEAGQ